MADAEEDLTTLGRICDRLRSLPEPRLVRPAQALGGAPVAEAVHELSAWAAEAQGVAAAVPRLHPLATADQLAVLGRDFLGWAGETSRSDALAQWRRRIEAIGSAV